MKKKTINANTEVIEILELFDKDFKAAIIKMALTNNYKYTSNKGRETKKNNLSKEVEDTDKEEPNGIFRTENCNN